MNLAMGISIVFAVAQRTYGQSAEELVNQLRGKAQGPQRSAEQMAQAYQKAVDYLLP